MKLPFEEKKREIVVKIEENEGSFERSVEELLDYGIVVLNKPAGPTSHQVSDYVKRILGLTKAGHSGTLDPNVTGVLPIALGKSTKVVQALLNAGKEYVCLMKLHDDFSEEVIREKFKEFVGKIKQVPPVKSAVKRVKREREVYYLEVMEIKGRSVLFRIGCQAGTYIRKICDDFGKSLNSGAHMQELVRTKAGPFSDKDWVNLHDLKDAFEEKELEKVILPVEKGVEHLPKIWIKDNAVDTICHGAQLSLPAVVKFHDDIDINDLVAIMSLKDELICLAKAKMNAINMSLQKKGIVAGNTKVFMERGKYPKFSTK
ncbi:RNA-guided pseudouridylation complex pseudouridine synthase subunit Cbf5 [archaeon]|nr:RNA-guided pseudouridylation complex pseudouridine synthase subunit Cbf5 [archaeon]|tara:strand:- start:1725 stop:2672 length:948 start_codon:yes stop_codon:yes gene_type:complete